ncbi:Lrp/AsnC family transcriptional regulator [Amycolatopsis jejuensis]|uniref:Lrp/AsnC family transcriptional regulator n=1 Tax=Amycolatopsis jejuensis TaxID=330084 RepID=UPI0005274F02|nr:AsnC family transcriptional regulator [Amycolatopsis jejuensis]
MPDVPFDELDLAIVDALRSSARATWRELAAVLGVDPATVARRWARMQAAGVAWVTAHPAGSITPTCALVEIRCAPGRSGEVAGLLAGDVEAPTVRLMSGARHILALAQAPDLGTLSRYVLDRVEHLPGITEVQSHPVTSSTVEAGRWRDGALDSEQRRRLAGSARKRPAHAGVLEGPDHRIAHALTVDGRMSFERLAEYAGIGPVAVGRRLTRLVDAGLVTFRCDTSPHLTGHSVAAVFFGSLDVRDLDAAEERIRSLPGVRASRFVAGPYNVVIDVWLRSTAEVREVERRMCQALPTLQVQDRAVVQRTVKLLGRILDEDGRSIRSVPLLPEFSPLPAVERRKH